MTAYRAAAPQCPTCGDPMTLHDVKSPVAAIDLCGRCGGVWIDWEDGDFTELAREVPPSPVRELARSGPGKCPRCNRGLVAEEFLDAAEVLRCGECGGAFLPYASIGKIAASTPAEARQAQRDGTAAELVVLLDGPADEQASPEQATSTSSLTDDVWTRIVRSVRSLFGRPRKA